MRIIFWLVGVYAVFTVLRILTEFHLFDFSIYYQAVQDIKHGVSMYSNPAMKYPLSGMLVLYPIGWLPYAIAEKIWTLISLVALGLALNWLRLMLPGLSKRSWVYIVEAIVLAFPYKFTLGMGQINLVILACLTLSLYAYLRGYNILAGVSIAIAAWLKITPLVLLLFFLRKRAYKAVLVAIVVYVLGWVLAGQLWGWGNVGEFFLKVVPSISTLGNSVYYNQAFTGVLARFGIPDATAAVVNYTLLAGMLITSYLATASKRESMPREIATFGLFIMSMILGSGLAWQHYFVWLIIPFVGIYAVLLKNRLSKKWWWGLLVAYVLVSANIKNPGEWTGIMTLALSHATVGTLILWELSLKLLKTDFTKIVTL